MSCCCTAYRPLGILVVAAALLVGGIAIGRGADGQSSGRGAPAGGPPEQAPAGARPGAADGATGKQAAGPDFIAALNASPGCLGVESAMTMSGKRAVFAWFKDK